MRSEKHQVNPRVNFSYVIKENGGLYIGAKSSQTNQEGLKEVPSLSHDNHSISGINEFPEL
jgi:hypothetical protein